MQNKLGQGVRVKEKEEEERAREGAKKYKVGLWGTSPDLEASSMVKRMAALPNNHSRKMLAAAKIWTASTYGSLNSIYDCNCLIRGLPCSPQQFGA